jgi:hypothetical protein
MGLFAFRRLRDQLEAASHEAASFVDQQSQPQEAPVQTRKTRSRKVTVDGTQ